jgi:RimJ/RimL family protein N-acetyltransferase
VAGGDARPRRAIGWGDVSRRPADRRPPVPRGRRGRAVGYVDCGTFDRCTVFEGEGPDGPIITETIDAVTGSIAFVIDPALRGRGLGRAMIATLTVQPELRRVELFEAGVKPDNIPSRHCLEGVGFQLRSVEPDFERMLYYRAWRADVQGDAPLAR